METKYGMVSFVLKRNKGVWLSGGEISNIIKSEFNCNVNTRSIYNIILTLIEIGFVVQIKTALKNTRIYCYEGLII